MQGICPLHERVNEANKNTSRGREVRTNITIGFLILIN